MTCIRNYKDLLVWQKGLALVKKVYELTSRFPEQERYGLISQLRRAAVSVPSNIAEGHARHTAGEFVLFISHSEGSLAELETQLIIATELGLCAESEARPIQSQVEELQKMLYSLRRKLAAPAANPKPLLPNP